LKSSVSRDIPVVIAQQSAQTLPAVYTTFSHRSELGFNDVILQSLVIPFPVVVFRKLVKRIVWLSRKYPRFALPADPSLADAGRMESETNVCAAHPEDGRPWSEGARPTEATPGSFHGLADPGGSAQRSVELGLRARPH
jgi:hypothetical protein